MDAQAMTGALLHITLGFFLGLAFGYVHFASLERVARMFMGDGPLWRAVGLQLARLAALAALMVGLTLLGAGALLAGMFGVLAAREIVLRRVRKDP
jgi:hypothetical protein